MHNIKIHSKEDFEYMRRAGKLASQVLDHITPFVKPGIKTEELDKICYDFIIANNAIPASLNYKGFPKSVCISPNHVVCHGIPNEKILVNGDIINIDVAVIVDGWFGDTSRMYIVGGMTSIKAKRLVDVTFNAMWAGIRAVNPGNRFGAIGHAIKEYVKPFRYGIVKDFVGHGIGQIYHTDPQIFHTANINDGEIMEPGMFFTIEPMINIGTADVLILQDNWTAITRDRSLSAQFEHTVAVTDSGYEVFTIS